MKGVIEAWADVLSDAVVSELSPGRVWEVTARNQQRYVLKQVSTFGAEDPVARFASEARILSHLRDKGLPVAPPVVTDVGRVWAEDDAGAPYALFPLLPRGTDPGLDPLVHQRIGQAIGEMHSALATCPFEIESWEVAPEQLSVWWQTAQVRLPSPALKDLSPHVTARWDRLCEALSRPRQRVHGDVHRGNVLTFGQKVTGIIDCDHLPLAPRAYDLGYFIAFDVHSRLQGFQPTEPMHEAVRFVIRYVLRGYQSVSGLGVEEVEDIPFLAVISALSVVTFFIEEYGAADQSWLRTVRWIGDNFDAMDAATDAK